MPTRSKRTVAADDTSAIATGATIPSRAPVQSRPEPFTITLTNGIVATWRMPDPFALIAFNGLIPDPTTAAVIQLLNEEKAATRESDPRKFVTDAQKVRGMYGLVAHMLESPRLDLKLEYGDGKEVLGRRDIGFFDVCQLYWAFRITPFSALVASSGADDAGGLEDSAPDGNDVQQAAE